ncbi:MAG TPA: M20/M25/M40 family metallo-hydrolase [Vicinamibacterales bacterium]|nr:M20/M25/M40 family metallo-hydrolase [Vicinamibacterales bacterium]
MTRSITLVFVLSMTALTSAQQPPSAAIEAETLQHFQALLRLDTSSPPGNETRAVEYLKGVFEKEGIPYQVFAKDKSRANIVARLKGNGKKRPILVMGHTDVVTVDPSKWTHPPFGAVRDGGYVYGRGAVDDKDNLVAGLMMMLMLKRGNVPLDRDVILLAESGEEGAPDVGAQFMADNHLDAINAEYCLAEGGGVVRRGGKVVQANIGTTEKEPRFVEIIARGPAGHGSVPSKGNAVTKLSAAVGKVAAWSPPIRINETTASYFKKLATMVPADVAKMYRDILNPDPKVSKAAADWMLENQPNHWSMTHTSLVPTIIDGGFRYNVIPSEAKATVDVRLHPDEDQSVFLDQLRKVINDPDVEVRWGRERYRPAGGSRIDTEAFAVLEAQTRKHYDTIVLPTMGVGATDMSNIRAKGIQCYGIGPALDTEDAAKGFGAHSDQERILESELHRFVRFQYDVVLNLARSK